jgi:nicotinate-nucleotide adenylyltransferase
MAPHRVLPRSFWLRPPGPVADGLTIGLLGGSFNPAHGGHAYVGETALKRLGLDYVWWLVSPGNPLKAEDGMAPFAARLDSARAAARHRRFIVTDIEQQLGTRYTIDTVIALQRRFPKVRFIWLMGSDNLEGFSRWGRWQDLARRIPIVVVQRPGSIMAALNAAPIRRFGMVRNLTGTMRPPALAVIDGARNGESATRLRALGRAHTGMLKQPH